MAYLVTGGTGFIGRRLIRKLLARSNEPIYVLVRAASADKLEGLRAWWGDGAERIVPIQGDLTAPELGVSRDLVTPLQGRIEHLFHLGALYDLSAPADAQMAANVAGTLSVVGLANRLGVRRFHYMSSIAVAGSFCGTFREDMFEEAGERETDYSRSKHEAERAVRAECHVPWRIYRPAIVVGDSRSGETDKCDGLYCFFKPVQRLLKVLPSWAPTLVLKGGVVHLIPVDFVVDAIDHIAHQPGLDGQCFHIADSRSNSLQRVIEIVTEAARPERPASKLRVALSLVLPPPVQRSLATLWLGPRIRSAVKRDLGIPADAFSFACSAMSFDTSAAERALAGSGIEAPDLSDYGPRLWRYWQEHLDPDLAVRTRLERALNGKVVLVTGGSSGIGLATAKRAAAAGATTIIVARNPVKLEAARRELEADGKRVAAYQCDITLPEQCAATMAQITAVHGSVDVLVNNAGRSIQRPIESSYDRFHDFERCMAVNYFGTVRMTLAVLPGMRKKGGGHVINISSIGVLLDPPHFSAYLASKAAVEAWTRSAATEFAGSGIDFTVVNMPLTDTPMIRSGDLGQRLPTLSPDDAASFIVQAMVERPARVATPLGILGQLGQLLVPSVVQALSSMPMAGARVPGEREGPMSASREEQLALARLMQQIR